MKKKDIVNELKNRLKTAGIDAAISWPRVEFTKTYPYLEFLQPVINRTDDTLKGNGVIRERGQLVINVVTEADDHTESFEERDGGEDFPNDLADEVADRFPSGLLLSITDGRIQIMNTPEIRAGFDDGNEWKVPVAIPYLATSDVRT